MVSKPLVLIAYLLVSGTALAQSGRVDIVDIKDAWARATPAKADTGAAYLTIVSPVPDELVSVSSPIAKKAGLHTMTMEGGVMKMRPLAKIDVPANEPVMLKPGGMHIMLQGLNGPLQAGQSFPLTLTFAKAGQKQIEVAIERAGSMGPEDHGGMNMPAPEKH